MKMEAGHYMKMVYFMHMTLAFVVIVDLFFTCLKTYITKLHQSVSISN